MCATDRSSDIAGTDSWAIQQYLDGSQTGDVSKMVASLAPDAALVSPIAGRAVFRGAADLKVILNAIYRSLRELRWGQHIGTGSTRVVMGEARVGPLAITDAMVFELDREGRIARIRPHLRPWLAVTLLALKLLLKLSVHPTVISRAFLESRPRTARPVWDWRTRDGRQSRTMQAAARSRER